MQQQALELAKALARAEREGYPMSEGSEQFAFRCLLLSHPLGRGSTTLFVKILLSVSYSRATLMP